MLNSHASGPLSKQAQGLTQIPDIHRHEISVVASFMRAIPLMASFLLFVFAASADVQRWGSRGIQGILVAAALLGVIGIVVFIPKRKFSK
jgi:hypothetical protein